VHDAPKPPPDRVSLSLEVLRLARATILLASGPGKADALARALAGPDPAVPASLLTTERLTVIADAAALAETESPR
jgi:6-phosphogluconolactonase